MYLYLRLLIKNILEIELLIEKRDTCLSSYERSVSLYAVRGVNCDLSHG